MCPPAKHNSSVHNAFHCDYGSCEKAYKTKFGLKRHYLSHIGVRPHQCLICGKRFTLTQYLSEHALIHEGVKPFVCAYIGCNKAFRQAGKLSIHRKKHNLVDFSDSSNESLSSFGETNCTFGTIEAVFTQIAAFPFPSFFYSRTLPVPPQCN